MADMLRSPVFAAVALALIVAEALWRRRAGARDDARGEAAASFGVYVGKIVAGGATVALIAPIYAAVWAIAPLQLPTDDWRVWVVGFVVVEFVYYWQHRFSHTVRWLWATHNVHHSSGVFAFPAAIRLGWTNAVSGGWLFFTLPIFAGFHPLVVTILVVVSLRYQFFLHTELIGKLGVLEEIFNTPSHHRVHHASNPDCLDKNFGGVLIVFDRLFGTFRRESDGDALRYGLTEPIASKNPFIICLREWARLARDVAASRTLAQALHAAFGPPGAVHDAPGVRTKSGGP
ncbi:MAG: sterol desaturase family protein [Pseudomonadota bacterium]